LFLLATVVFLVVVGLERHVPMALAIIAGTFGIQVPADALHDKLTGSLEVLTTLPVSASTLAAARLTVIVTLAALGGVSAAAAGGIGGPAVLEDAGLVQIVTVFFVAAWIVLSALGAALLALLLRFKAKFVASYGVIVGFLAFVSTLALYDRLFGSPMRLIQAVLTSDHTLAIAIGSALVGSAIVLTASFLVTRKAFEIYEPELDALS